MDKIVYECRYFTLRVREVLIMILVLILLFFVLQSCQKNDIDKKKEEKIGNICTFTNENINDLYQLLSRSDICREEWYQDVDDYIQRLEDQNRWIKTKDTDAYRLVSSHQTNLLESLKTFRKNKKKEDINQLEEAYQEYKAYYGKQCQKGEKE